MHNYLLEQLCREMHDRYEDAAAGHGWQTNLASRKPWSEVPPANQATMRTAMKPIADEIARLHTHITGLHAALDKWGHVHADALRTQDKMQARIADLETVCDPAGDLRRLRDTTEQRDALTARVAELEAEIEQWRVLAGAESLLKAIDRLTTEDDTLFENQERGK